MMNFVAVAIVDFLLFLNVKNETGLEILTGNSRHLTLGGMKHGALYHPLVLQSCASPARNTIKEILSCKTIIIITKIYT